MNREVKIQTAELSLCLPLMPLIARQLKIKGGS